MSAYTLIHVAISLIAIAAGFVVAYGFVRNREWNHWTELFLSTTVMTSVTGFGFPATHVTPGHVVGVISLLVLAAAIYARYRAHLVGHWQSAYVINSIVALYFNFFVLIAQSFQKISLLKAIAPTQAEWPFAAAQLAALIGFLLLGRLATVRYRHQPFLQTVAA